MSRFVQPVLLALCFLGANTAHAEVELISSTSIAALNTSGGNTTVAGASADGRYVLLLSSADNLVPGDSNEHVDAIRVDRQTGARVLVSRSTAAQANGPTLRAAISGDGRYVAFESAASNLVPGDNNGLADVFWKDQQSGTIRRIGAINRETGYSPLLRLQLSADGQHLLMEGWARDWLPGTPAAVRPLVATWSGALASPLDAFLPPSAVAFDTSLSGDGRCLGWAGSFANSSVVQVQLYELDTQINTLLSRTQTGGAPGASSSSNTVVSADCNSLAFVTSASGIATGQVGSAVIVWRRNQAVVHASVAPDGAAGVIESMTASPSMQRLIFARNLFPSIRLESVTLGDSNSVIVNSLWNNFAEVILDNGTVATSTFTIVDPTDRNAISDALFLPDIGSTNGTWLSSPDPAQAPQAIANGASMLAVASRDGDLIAFDSEASNLVPGDTNNRADVFVRNLRTGITQRITQPSGTEFNGVSDVIDMSENGQFVLFRSCATNVVSGDSNAQCDQFLWDRNANQIERINVGSDGAQSDREVPVLLFQAGQISADGRYVLFISQASNFSPLAGNSPQLYLRDRQTGTTTLLSTGSTPPNGGAFFPMMSANGDFVVFSSFASNLPLSCGIYGRVLPSGPLQCVVVESAGLLGLSRDGRYVHANINGLLVRLDRRDGSRQTIVGPPSNSTPPQTVGRSARFSSFLTQSTQGNTPIRKIYMHDAETGQTSLVGDAPDLSLSIYANGRTLSSTTARWTSSDSNGISDIYVEDKRLDGLFGGRFEGGFE